MQDEDHPSSASIQLKSKITTISREDEPSVAAAAAAAAAGSLPDGSSSTGCTPMTQQQCLQTPHTLRLLKLIHEGTPEYAETAIDRLQSTAKTMGTLNLWDLLGRLAMIVTTAESWKTRQAAAQALQVMAQYIPISDQKHFLEVESFHRHHEEKDTTTQTTKQDAAALYLTVPELLQEHSGIDKILQHGKELWSSAEERYTYGSGTVMEEDDDAKIHSLDRRAGTDADFVQRRIRMQRNILASRLGLAALTDILGEQSIIDNSLFVSNDDLAVVQQQQHPPLSRKRKRTSISDRQSARTATTTAAADEAIQADSQDPYSIRALLVMEIQKQQQKKNQSHSFLHGHSNPQNLLATELIYRMMDVRWHVRHGAILGIQALIHAWRNHHHHPSSSLISKFGAWPNDVLSRCLCILAMDRFGDFANADGVVVAPVREVAGQCISLLTIQMKPPESIQNATLAVLHRLLQHTKDWEVRHGAMLAFKYMSVVFTTRDTVSDDCQRCLEPHEKSMLESMGRAAIQHLEDPSDDVKSASAQTLLWIIRNTNGQQREQLADVIQECIEPTFRALQTTRTISACWVDHVELFSVLLDRENISDLLLQISTLNLKAEDSPNCGQALVRILIQLLDSDFQSVRVAALRSMCRICRTPIFQPSHDTDTEKGIRLLVERVYQVFCSPKQEHAEERTKDEGFFFEEAWKQISAFVGRSLDTTSLKMLLARLLSVYFEVGCKHTIDPDEDLRHVEAADYLAVFCGQCNFETVQEIIAFTLLVFAESPWPSQFEAACLFYRALIHEQFPQGSLVVFANKLSLDCPPFCAHSTNDQMRRDIEKHPTLYDEVFSVILTKVTEQSFKSIEAARTVTENWRENLSVNDIIFIAVWSKVDLASMRIQTTIAGIALSKGLPPKVTSLVRALMTSFKNESACISRQKLTRVYIEELLHLMQLEPRLEKARQKIFQSLCDAALGDVESVKLTAFQIIKKYATTGLKNIPSVWSRLHPLLLENVLTLEDGLILEAVTLLDGLTIDSSPGNDLVDMLIEHFSVPLVMLACEHTSSNIRSQCSFSLVTFCHAEPNALLRYTIPSLSIYMKEKDKELSIRDAYSLLNEIVVHSGIAISPYVRCLLPIVLSMMASPREECSRTANNIFSYLVRVAPLVQHIAEVDDDSTTDERASVIDHLIFGKPLPICNLCEDIRACLRESNTVLRHYQLEGISWLQFLQTVNLSGVLCDSMGLGKTLQALVGVAIAHNAAAKKRNCCSLVVCPSTLVGHWLGEIEKYFPVKDVFQPLIFVGNRQQRVEKWRNMMSRANIVVTSYAYLRSDIELLSSTNWCYCILDEGHLLRNPKTGNN
jgi:hypothetical protein